MSIFYPSRMGYWGERKLKRGWLEGERTVLYTVGDWAVVIWNINSLSLGSVSETRKHYIYWYIPYRNRFIDSF